MQRARGLEGTMELAAGYRGIGLSMFPQHLSTEHVQTKAPPIQPPATGSQGPLTEQKLMDMRLSELPVWLTSRRLVTPREAVAAVQRGWLRYYRKYIDVRKGGIGGIGMLLAGYCILSYAWNYPHIKQDRWRKYH
ncbi:ATP synthase subunit f, mitochondrial-like [Megalops cyprinoides]|uniref:ATP synthase subunit f, mitochondrial-like n=1 Tax=Megalops cyprinoides TaxID=118141 RepID=UPI001864E10E|nr:ATP synthase subunit f, mitochondrial-like [Megalops cyprinoides]